MYKSVTHTKRPKGSVYIVSFVDWPTKWVEAHTVRNKTAQTMAPPILNKIFPRVGTIVKLITDNGENL